MWFREACLGFLALFRVFLLFPHYFYSFSSLLGIFAIFGGILVIFGGEMGFWAFWRHFKWFYGLLEAFSGIFREIW